MKKGTIKATLIVVAVYATMILSSVVAVAGTSTRG